MKTTIQIIGLSLCLAACSYPSVPNDNENSVKQVVQVGSTEISVPVDLQIRPTTDEARRYIDNDGNENDLDKPKELRIAVTTNLADPCSPSLTGASQTERLAHANGKAEWGRLDWTQWRRIDKAYPDALCQVPLEHCGDVDEWSYEGCQKGQAAYALCSEKDGKTVVICISQMTDNPEQAKEIFETFRWTR